MIVIGPFALLVILALLFQPVRRFVLFMFLLAVALMVWGYVFSYLPQAPH